MASISGPTAPQQPAARQAYLPEEYTVAGVVLKFFEEKVKDVAKALGYTGFWLGQAIPNLPPEVKSFSGTMGDFKNFVSATEVPKKGAEMVSAYNALFAAIASANRVSEAANEAFKKTTAFVNSVVDGIDFGSRFVAINTTVMTWLKGVNFTATLGSAINGIREQIGNISKHYGETSKVHLYVLNGLRDLAYAAVGVQGLYSILTVTPVLPWLMVGCLTVGLTMTIGGYFYEKLCDPEGKGKNLNPEVVIRNSLARASHALRNATV